MLARASYNKQALIFFQALTPKKGVRQTNLQPRWDYCSFTFVYLRSTPHASSESRCQCCTSWLPTTCHEIYQSSQFARRTPGVKPISLPDPFCTRLTHTQSSKGATLFSINIATTYIDRCCQAPTPVLAPRLIFLTPPGSAGQSLPKVFKSYFYISRAKAGRISQICMGPFSQAGRHSTQSMPCHGFSEKHG